VDRDRVKNILNANRKIGFVQRILKPNDFPKLPNKDGSFSTHSMVWGESDGKYIVFPTVLFDGKQLQRFDPETAFKHVMQTGNFIEFPTAKDAAEFSVGYKQFWEK